MFIDEAKLSARIQHPNVVHIEDLGEYEGDYFLAMEYVHGCSLSDFLVALDRRDLRLAPELAVAIAIQLADGLHAAHETKGADGALLGVVHRDVSPQNVLLSYAGNVKLIDFGVAKAQGVGDAANDSAGGGVRGKLRYMPPEQAEGEAVDRRADVFALGAVLWEMLTLCPRVRAKSYAEMLSQVISPRMDPPSTHAPGIAPALDNVVMTALAAAKSDRFASANEFRRKLSEAIDSRVRTSFDASFRKRCLRHFRSTHPCSPSCSNR
jgi:serine/threonine-protein kinase